MLKRAQRRCKICREKFTPAFENHRWCCPEHGAEFAMQELEKKREKQAQEKRRKSAQLAQAQSSSETSPTLGIYDPARR